MSGYSSNLHTAAGFSHGACDSHQSTMHTEASMAMQQSYMHLQMRACTEVACGCVHSMDNVLTHQKLYAAMSAVAPGKYESDLRAVYKGNATSTSCIACAQKAKQYRSGLNDKTERLHWQHTLLRSHTVARCLQDKSIRP